MIRKTSADQKHEHGKEAKSNSKDDSKPEDTLVEPDGDKLKMSRGLRPEVEVDFEKLKDLFVYDELGNKIRFTDIYEKQKTIIVFTRHFLDFITKEYVEDLALIPAEYLQEVNVQLVVIGPAPFKFIRSFKELTNFKHTMYCDPDRELYKALELPVKLEFGALEKSKHVKSGAMMGVLKSIWRAMQYQEFQGDTKQQGGAFILGPGETVHFCHIDQTCADHININDLLIEGGVQPVSFPKDQRVLTI